MPHCLVSYIIISVVYQEGKKRENIKYSLKVWNFRWKKKWKWGKYNEMELDDTELHNARKHLKYFIMFPQH